MVDGDGIRRPQLFGAGVSLGMFAGILIGSLVTLHPTIQVYKGLSRRNVLLEAGLHLLGIRNRIAWSYAIGGHFSLAAPDKADSFQL